MLNKTVLNRIEKFKFYALGVMRTWGMSFLMGRLPLFNGTVSIRHPSSLIKRLITGKKSDPSGSLNPICEGFS